MSFIRIPCDLNFAKLDGEGRTELWLVIQDRAPHSPLYQNNPVVKQAADRVIASGATRDAARKKALSLRQQATEAEEQEAKADAAFVRDTTNYKGVAEDVSAVPADMEGLGLHARMRTNSAPAELVAPTEITARPGDPKAGKGSIFYRTPKIRGARAYQIALNPTADPASEAAYVLANASAARGTIGGYTSGAKYYLRIRAMRGTQFSDWSEPVLVTAR